MAAGQGSYPYILGWYYLDVLRTARSLTATGDSMALTQDGGGPQLLPYLLFGESASATGTAAATLTLTASASGAPGSAGTASAAGVVPFWWGAVAVTPETWTDLAINDETWTPVAATSEIWSAA